MKKLACIAIACFSLSSFAHSGGTDARGCHVDHRTGVYHCH